MSEKHPVAFDPYKLILTILILAIAALSFTNCIRQEVIYFPGSALMAHIPDWDVPVVSWLGYCTLLTCLLSLGELAALWFGKGLGMAVVGFVLNALKLAIPLVWYGLLAWVLRELSPVPIGAQSTSFFYYFTPWSNVLIAVGLVLTMGYILRLARMK